MGTKENPGDRRLQGSLLEKSPVVSGPGLSLVDQQKKPLPPLMRSLNSYFTHANTPAWGQKKTLESEGSRVPFSTQRKAQGESGPGHSLDGRQS